MTDQFRMIPGYEGLYEISRDSVVRSVNRTVVTKNGIVKHLRSKTLIPSLKNTGHEAVNLSREGKVNSFTLDILMYATHPELSLPVENLEGEIWRDIRGFPNYQVSNKGRVKRLSYQRKIKTIQFMTPEKLIHQSLHNFTGYWVWLKVQNCKVADLVYTTFVGTLRDKQYVRYLDGDIANLCVENLYLGDWFHSK